MAEHVTTFSAGPQRDRRLLAATDRFGGATGEVRGQSRRDADGLFRWLAAAKRRYGITRVMRHVCRHDEGIGTCTVDQEG